MANKITTILDLDGRGFDKTIKNIRKEIATTDGTFNKFKVGAQGAFGGLKQFSTEAAFAAGAAMVAFAAKSVQSASLLEESTNAVNVSFGKAAAGVLEIGENADESMGLSKAAFNEAAVGFAAFASTIAGPGGDAADIIGNITGRASDFASVMNLDVAEAANVFRSSLSGETEPIKRFGIDLSAAAVEAFALANGLVKSKSEMTEAIKVQARYGLLMQETSKFQGDFSNTSDGLANSTRIAAARIENFQARVGEELIPTIATAVNVAMNLADAFEAVGISAGGVNEKLDENRGFWGDVSNSVQNSLNPLRMAGQLYNQGAYYLDNFTGSADDATEAADNAAVKIHGAGQAMVQMSIDTALAEKASDEFNSAYIEHAEGVQRASEEQADKVAADLQRMEDAYDQLERSLSDRSAYLDIEDAFASVGEAAVAAAETAGLSFEEQKAAARDQERAVIDLKQRVIDYSEEVGNIPPETTTRLLALIDQGKLMEAALILEEMERERTVVFNVSTRGTVPGNAVGTARVMHDGGIVGGRSFAGLAHDEVPAILQKGEAVLTQGQQAAMLSGGGSGRGGDTYNITVAGLTGPQVADDIVNKVMEYKRRNGGLPWEQ